MRVNVDPTTTVSSGFGYAEAGRYLLRIVDVKEKEGPKGAYLEWKMEFTDPNVVPVEEGKKLGSIFEITTLRLGAQFRLRQLVEATGMSWMDFESNDLLQQEIEANVDVEEYNGNIRNVIKRFIPAKR